MKKIWPLRVGLGIMYLYSGSDLLLHPSAWSWAVPAWFSRMLAPIMTTEAYLSVQGGGEIVIGFFLLAWFLPRWGLKIASALAIIEMASILLFVGINSITFRDIGLLGGALTLFLIAFDI